MSPLDALRARRAADGLPPPTSDEELLAWSDRLVAGGDRPRRRRARAEPLRAARVAVRRVRLVRIVPPPPRRTLRFRRGG